MEEDLYKILGVSKSADEKEIKTSYRKIARENHPDLNPDNAAAEERFKRASTAFEVLSDPKKKKLYDEFGVEGLREGFNADQARQYKQWQGAGGGRQSYSYGGGGGGHEDIFGNIFGGKSPFDTSDYSNFGGFHSGPTKGQDIEATLTLEFMVAVEGGELDINVGGRKIKVRIPAGAAEGDRLRLKGKGQPAPAQAPRGSKAGDLLLTIHVKDHAFLRRDGLNLYLDLPIKIGEAILGAKIPIPTPHGEFKVTIPPGVNSGAKLRLKGKGVHRGKKKGHFYVVLQLHTPDRIDEAIQDATAIFDAGYSEDIRQELHKL